MVAIFIDFFPRQDEDGQFEASDSAGLERSLE